MTTLDKLIKDRELVKKTSTLGNLKNICLQHLDNQIKLESEKEKIRYNKDE